MTTEQQQTLTAHIEQLADHRRRLEELEQLIRNTIASLGAYSDRLDALEANQ